MKIVVGLGNPGRKYAGTRHNVGFDVLDLLARRGQAAGWRGRFESETVEINVDGTPVLLVAPQTFMNLSGQAVRKAVDFYKLPLADLLLVVDDMDLPVGRLRLRADGSAGGQKGLKNTIEHLGTNGFARLRIGIGRPVSGLRGEQHVLQKFAADERPVVDAGIERAVQAVIAWIRQGLPAAMNEFNRTDDGEPGLAP